MTASGSILLAIDKREAYKGVAHDLVAQELQKTVAIRDFAKNSLELSTGPAH